jgi:2-amino-4-hydroxy-6-hydroxymethyldihydropteridine diphosphokinase
MPLAFIALGANLPSPAGPPDATLAAALPHLALLGRIAARSSLYSTALSIERLFGRDRSAALPNGPRTLDLDLLLYADLVLSESGFEIPHPRLAQRAFVLIPLVEIAPNAVNPRSGLTAAQLLANLSPRADAGEVVPFTSLLWPSESDRASKEAES